MSIVIVKHEHDERAGVYRIIVADEVVVPGGAAAPRKPSKLRVAIRPLMKLVGMNPDPVLPDPEPPEDEVVGYENHHEVVWSDDDPQWFSDGERIPDEKAAAKQRKILGEHVKRVVDERDAVIRSAGAPRELPGAGERLL